MSRESSEKKAMRKQKKREARIKEKARTEQLSSHLTSQDKNRGKNAIFIITGVVIISVIVLILMR